jgi:hypothetical protein
MGLYARQKHKTLQDDAPSAWGVTAMLILERFVRSTPIASEAISEPETEEGI